MHETLTTIISSGIISALVSLCIIFFSLGKYKEKVDRNDRNYDVLHKDFLEVIKKLATIEGGLERDRATNLYIKSKSPLSLTETGKALLLDSKGKDFIDAKKQEFLKQIKLKKPKTAYDVQELSKKLIEGSVELDEFNEIKEFAFRKGLNLEIIIAVLGIYLRDFLLSELDFKVEDIKD